MIVKSSHSDAFKIDYNLTVTAKNVASSSISAQEHVHNIVTLTARNLIRNFLNTGTSGLGITYVGAGTDTGAASTTQTALVAEVIRPATIRKVTGDGTLTVYSYLGSSDANGNTLAEAGLFDASTQGNMYARAVHSGIPKTNSICVSYQWALSIASST